MKELKKALIFIGICFMVLLVMFLWKEHFDLGKAVNDQKFSNFFSIVGSFATATSIFLLYRQIKEMQEDRKASNLPDLYPKIFTFGMMDRDDTIDSNRNVLTRIPTPVILNEDGSLGSWSKPVLLDIYNIGLGAAKEIKYEWQYQREEVIKMIDGIFEYDAELMSGDNNNYKFKVGNLEYNHILQVPKKLHNDLKHKCATQRRLNHSVSSWLHKNTFNTNIYPPAFLSCNSLINCATNDVQPVWWLAPSPFPLSP